MAVSHEYQNMLRSERAKWEQQVRQMQDDHEQAILELKTRNHIKDVAEQQVKFNEALAKAINEKDKEIHQVRTNGTDEKTINELREKVQEMSLLAARNVELEAEIKRLNEERLGPAMGASVMTVATETAMTQSMSTAVSRGNVCVKSVEKGQTVMVVWSDDHNHYVVYTEGGLALHFVHPESLSSLGLDEEPKKHYITADVIEKEYCQARKPSNRFNVPQGTKFYRVKLAPA